MTEFCRLIVIQFLDLRISLNELVVSGTGFSLEFSGLLLSGLLDSIVFIQVHVLLKIFFSPSLHKLKMSKLFMTVKINCDINGSIWVVTSGSGVNGFKILIDVCVRLKNTVSLFFPAIIL